MSNQRTTFAKRQREQNKKDKLKAKQERLASRRPADGDAPRQKGPPIATFAEAAAMITAGAPPDEPPAVTVSAPPPDRARDTQATSRPSSTGGMAPSPSPGNSANTDS